MPRRPPSPPRASRRASTPDTGFDDLRVELLQLMFGAVAHELGNLSSPIGLIADALAAAATPERRESLAGTLRLVATGMRDLTSHARRLRGAPGEELLAPAAQRDVARWWTGVAGMMTDMLPRSGAITCQGATGVAPAAVLGALSVVVPALLRGAAFTCPDARTFLVAFDVDAGGDGLSGHVTAMSGIAVGQAGTVGSRWIGLALDEIRERGGTLTPHATTESVRWSFMLPCTLA